jgi:transcription elongation GreA/GreB family factor
MALIGHKVGEKIKVSPTLETTYTIKKIKYLSA